MSEQDVELTEDQISSEKNSHIYGIIQKIIMFGVCLGLPLDRLEYGMMCRIPIVTWLLVMAGFYFLGLLRNLILLFSLRKTYYKKVKKHMETFDTCCIMLPQIGWLIYGNTFIYSRAGMECKDLTW